MPRIDVHVDVTPSDPSGDSGPEVVTPAGVPPVRSVRRATARRASRRRAVARRLHGDEEAMIINFLADHPQSTAGHLARALNLDPEGVSTHLAHLASLDEITRAAHGYTIRDTTDRQVGI
jgi:hypothetical protein